MYEPTEIEILEAYDDYIDEVGADSIKTPPQLWLEAFRRGMRFNPKSDPDSCQD